MTWDGNSVTPTLLTEYLDPDRDPTTNAVEDLVALAGTDGYVDNDDFDNDLYLWFDRNTDGSATGDEMEALSPGARIDVSQFDDIVITDALTGSVIAAKTVAGVIEGTYGPDSNGLEDAVLRDVFLPVDPLVGDSVGVVDVPVELTGDDYYEDNPDGFELNLGLNNPDGTTWKELTRGLNGNGFKDNGDYEDGIFLLTVRAKTSGTTFNLSDGARLEGEPTDTWLIASRGRYPTRRG